MLIYIMVLDYSNNKSNSIKFSASDNAILASHWFTESRLPAIVPAFDLYVEINAANVAQHRIFWGNPSFIDKKMNEKSRVGELSTEEILVQEIVDNVVL